MLVMDITKIEKRKKSMLTTVIIGIALFSAKKKEE